MVPDIMFAATLHVMGEAQDMTPCTISVLYTAAMTEAGLCPSCTHCLTSLHASAGIGSKFYQNVSYNAHERN